MTKQKSTVDAAGRNYGLNPTKKQDDAFEYYYAMDKRRLRSLIEKFGVSWNTINKWNKKFNWQKRVVERDLEILRKTEEKVTDEVSDMLTRHIKLAVEMQDKGQAVVSSKIGTFRDGVLAVKTGVEIERISRGEPIKPDKPEEEDVIVTIQKILQDEKERKKVKKKREKQEISLKQVR